MILSLQIHPRETNVQFQDDSALRNSSLRNKNTKVSTTSPAGGLLSPFQGIIAFPPKGGLRNRSICYWWPLKSGLQHFSLLFGISFQSIPLILLCNILRYRRFIHITDCFAIISACPKVAIIFLSILWIFVKQH